MNYMKTDAEYNSFLAQCYSVIYRADPLVWGALPNSDLVARVPAPLGRILDLGCGYGKNFRHLLSADTNVVGVDVCAHALELAWSRFSREISERRLTLIHGDENSVQGEFDLVVCSGVLVDHLLPRRVRLAARLWELTAAHGQLFLTVFGAQDPACGRGAKVEPNTYVHDFGFPVHYFQPYEVQALFDGLSISYFNTRIKHDSYPNPHLHETHVLVGNKLLHYHGSRAISPSNDAPRMRPSD